MLGSLQAPLPARARRPSLPAVVELFKPITWFPPMWAFACGIVSAGTAATDRWLPAIAGVLLAGPLVCGTSQAVNDWFDRHVDRINEPDRPIPSGRVPGAWGLGLAIAGTCVSLAVAAALGSLVLGAAMVGIVLAWAYSAPPARLKRNGWCGNSAVALAYEGLPWFTGAALIAGSMPGTPILALAVLYSVGAHGIMTLNDFKAIEGDVQTGIRSLPVLLGVDGAARAACAIMAAPQVVVVALLVGWGAAGHAVAVAALLAVQLVLMIRLLADPRGRAAWYSAWGVTCYVAGMMVSAFAVRALGAVA